MHMKDVEGVADRIPTARELAQWQEQNKAVQLFDELNQIASRIDGARGYMPKVTRLDLGVCVIGGYARRVLEAKGYTVTIAPSSEHSGMESVWIEWEASHGT